LRQRFIDGGFLSPEFVSRLQPSSSDPNRKSYYVPAGAPYLSGTQTDPPSSYFVMMGQGTLTLINTFRVTSGFRIKIDTEGAVIQIDATMQLGPLGSVTVFGMAALRLSGLVCAMSVEMDAAALRAVGLDFDVDAVIGINTSSSKVVVHSESDPNAAPIEIEPKSSFFRAGGLMAVRIPQTTIELFQMQGVFLLDIGETGLGIFADASINVSAAAGLISASASGAFFITKDGVAADIDLAISPLSPTFSNVFEFNAAARLVFNTTTMDQGINVPERFLQYLSPRRSRGSVRLLPDCLQPTMSCRARYRCWGARPELRVRTSSFHCRVTLRLVQTFEVSGSFQMAFASGMFEVKFDAQMKVEPIGEVNASGVLQIDSRGVVARAAAGWSIHDGPGGNLRSHAAGAQHNRRRSTD
jgi:hypothetical protein